MKKGEIYEGVIEKVDFPNKGIVITDGQKVTVNGVNSNGNCAVAFRLHIMQQSMI